MITFFIGVIVFLIGLIGFVLSITNNEIKDEYNVNYLYWWIVVNIGALTCQISNLVIKMLSK